MASAVKINIPGVGMVEAENAASEATLLAILAAMQKSEAAKRKEEKSNAAALKKQQADQIKAAKEWEDSLKGMTDEEKKAVTDKKKRQEDRKKLWEDTKTGSKAAGKELFGAFSSVAKSAISVTTAFLTSYDDIANNPIAAGTALINVGIDSANTAVHGVANAATGLAGAFGPVAGAFVGGLASLVTGISDAAAAILKATNDVMAKEFQKSTQALKDYTKQGASFAGGMNEMRVLANDAGLSLAILSKAATTSSSDLRAAGMTQGEGTAALAKGFNALTKTVGKSGASLSNELLALGYGYEEQMEIQAQYMAQQKAAGRDLKNIAPEELARGTKEYATNLKVISDITGQDAKKLMDKARTESMRGALMGKLDEKQQEAYKNAYSTMMAMGPEMGPKLQQALTQVMAGGPVTDPVIAGNAEIMAMIKKTAGGVSEGNADMTAQTQKNLSEASANIKKHGETATDVAKLFGGEATGVASGMADMNNVFRSFQLDPDAAAKSKEAADAQSSMAGKAGSVEQGFATITSEAQKAAAVMEKFTGSHLDTYAKLLADTFQEAVDTLQKGVNMTNMTTAEKATGAAAGAAGYGATGALAGAAIGSVVPLLGTAVGAALGGIGGAIYGGFKGWTGMAEGGWASGDPSGFLEKLHGTELVIPTTSGGMIDTTSTGFSELVKAMTGTDVTKSSSSTDELIGKIDDLIKALSKHTENSSASAAPGGGDMIASAFNSMQDMLAKQLGVHEEMAVHAKDNKDLLDKLLKVSM